MFDAYFEFRSETDAQRALGEIQKDTLEYSGFCDVRSWRPNNNKRVVEIDLCNDGASVPLIAKTLRATKVTHNNQVLWPKSQ